MTVQWRCQTPVAGADAKGVGPEPVYQYLADRLVVADEVQQGPTIWGKRIPGPAGKADTGRTVHPAPPRVQPGSFNMKSKIPSAHQAQPCRLRGGPRSGVRGEPAGVAHVRTIGVRDGGGDGHTVVEYFQKNRPVRVGRASGPAGSGMSKSPDFCGTSRGRHRPRTFRRAYHRRVWRRGCRARYESRQIWSIVRSLTIEIHADMFGLWAD